MFELHHSCLERLTTNNVFNLATPRAASMPARKCGACDKPSGSCPSGAHSRIDVRGPAIMQRQRQQAGHMTLKASPRTPGRRMVGIQDPHPGISA